MLPAGLMWSVVMLSPKIASSRAPAPFRRPLEHIAVTPSEAVARDGARDRLADLAVGGPDVLQIDWLAVIALAERVLGQIGADPPRQRIGDKQRGGGQGGC